MEQGLEEKLAEAIWAAKSLFDRGKTSGASANLSVRHGERLYVTGSGTCFGRLRLSDFSEVSLMGEHLGGPKPSKEFPLHAILYRKSEEIQAVLHIHSPYAVIWSCLEHRNETDCIPDHTPYLKMKLGTVGMIPYEKPGSKELFTAFEERVRDSDGYLLGKHGPVVGGRDIMDAFYKIEELEESSRIAWELKKAGIR